MIFHKKRLLADNSHEISCLIVIFERAAKFEIGRLLQIIGGASWVNFIKGGGRGWMMGGDVQKC